MPRALVSFERRPDGGWRPTTVWLATARKVEAKALPGDARRQNWMNAILRDAVVPRTDPFAEETGTWEDWIEWAKNALANGHDTWAVEVEPELTVDALYQREILDTTPKPMTAPNLRPSAEIPQNLGGYRKVEPR